MQYPFVRPEIAPVSEWSHLLDVAYERRYFTNFGELETRLSKAIHDKFGGANSSTTLAANATCGLTAALIAQKVSGKVVVPDFTFPATLDAVISARCTAFLCDIDPTTCEMSVEALDRICSENEIAAIMPVRAYGFVRDLTPLIEVARRHGVPVIVDGAAALGGGRIEVAEDLTEVHSLHATKSFGIGEGGVVFAHESRRDAVRQALNFGLRSDRQFGFGINGKMSEFHAAVGLAQMAHVERLIAGRRDMATWYGEILKDFPDLGLPADVGPTAWSNYPVILPKGTDTESFQAACHARAYQVRRYYWPTLQRGFTEPLENNGALDVSSDISDRAVCLPLYPNITSDEKAKIAAILEECLVHGGIERGQ